ncbi:hypothetical protein SAMN05421739_101328 [Pontibacter chinhatensis]|uniref:STAS/SEC14 domain-containing protein n=2 Tax=Pontibacter chinhatensis TaxID=1436961 RepID=A0A1I2MGS4_9BACT|nr:hypothetical protein SAMN05421739_101328 [Pontibacter chinhatensis]
MLSHSLLYPSFYIQALPNASANTYMDRKVGNGNRIFIPGEEVQELARTEKLLVCYHSSDETLLIQWEGSISSEELRSGYELILEQVRRFRPVKWLLDLQKRSTIRRDDQRWIFEQVFPEALQLVGDDIFVGVVLPVFLMHDLVSELTGDELIQQGNLMVMHHFMYPQEAQRWLNEMYLLKTGS